MNRRVLHVLYELKASGAEAMLKSAAPEWHRYGVDCEILATGPTRGMYASTLEAAGYRLHHLPFKRSPGFFAALWRFLRRERYDVVHLHMEAANFWFGFTAFAAFVPRVVRTLHSTFAFSGFLAWRRAVQRRLLRTFGVTHVAISPSVAEIERRHFRNPTVLIPNWFDSARFYPPSAEERAAARMRWGLSDDAFAIAVVGNCSAIKNHEALIAAIAQLDSASPIVCLHAGEEPPHRPERELAEQRGCLDRFRFLGPVSEPRDVFHAADAFVMPSLHEGFGLAAVEAIASGLPAVLTDVPGLRDFRPHFTGLCYAEPTPEGLATALRQLMASSPESRRAMTAGYEASANHHYGRATGLAAHAALYGASSVADGYDACAPKETFQR